MQTTSVCDDGFKQCGLTSSKVLCLKDNLNCPINSLIVTDPTNSGVDVAGKFQIF